MKTIAKKTIMALVCLLTVATTALASDDKPVTIKQMPNAAQQVLNQYFGNRKVALSKMDAGMFDKAYDVIFTDGDKIEFDRNGRWTEISSKRKGVPAQLVPQPIRHYVQSNYSKERITGIERSKKGYSVDLSNGLEIKFNKKFQVVGIDD